MGTDPDAADDKILGLVEKMLNDQRSAMKTLLTEAYMHGVRDGIDGCAVAMEKTITAVREAELGEAGDSIVTVLDKLAETYRLGALGVS